MSKSLSLLLLAIVIGGCAKTPVSVRPLDELYPIRFEEVKTKTLMTDFNLTAFRVWGETSPGAADVFDGVEGTGMDPDESGRMENKQYVLCENVVLTQKDVREVQLAKAAIRAGIELLTEQLGVSVNDIQQVYLAGAFGNYLTPASACRIGMIPPVLVDRIIPIGNAAGEGAKLCALRKEEFNYSKSLAAETEFLELASLPQFQDCYVDALEFSEEEL